MKGSLLFLKIENNPFFEADSRVLHHWVSGCPLLQHSVVTQLGLRVMSYHHICKNEKEKERKVGMWKAFWLLCKFFRVTTHSYPRTCWTQGVVRTTVNIREDLI